LKANQVQSALGTNPPGSRIGSAQSNPLPNAAQLRVLVQQIQLAVQAGHLNAQVMIYHNSLSVGDSVQNFFLHQFVL
jgi:hypothetical protein